MRRTRAFVIVDDVIRRIVVGELVPGQALPTEPEWESQYSVSRSGVREAMQTLEAKGFISIRHGSGMTVAPRTKWNALDPLYLAVSGAESDLFQQVLEAHYLIEPQVAAVAAAKANADDIEELDAMLHALEALSTKATDPETAGERVELDISFHAVLTQITGNPVLITLHNSICELGRPHRLKASSSPRFAERAVHWHRVILDAVRAADSDAAFDAMRMHLREVRASFQAAQLREAEGAGE